MHCNQAWTAEHPVPAAADNERCCVESIGELLFCVSCERWVEQLGVSRSFDSRTDCSNLGS